MYLTKEDLTAISDIVSATMTGTVSKMIDDKFNVMNDRFKEMEERFDAKLDAKLKPVYEKLDQLDSRLKHIEIIQLENFVIPKLKEIESCYLSTYNRYVAELDTMGKLKERVDVIYTTVENHSKQLQKLSINPV